jgi:hypothetical protein
MKNQFQDYLNYSNNIHDNLFVRKQILSYKNLSEHLEKKYQRLLNEVESPFGVEQPLSAGGPSDDPNTKYIKGVESAGDSVRPQLPPFNPDLKVWMSRFTNGSSNNQAWSNWASFLNALYTNWNNYWFWNSGVIEFVEGLFGDDYPYQWGPGNGIVVTEQMKQIIWNCIQDMMTAASTQGTNPTTARNAASRVLWSYQTQHGQGTSPWVTGEFSPNFSNYYLPGISQLPSPPPWMWNPNMPLPFPNAPTVPPFNPPAGVQGGNQPNQNQPGFGRGVAPAGGSGRAPVKGSSGRKPSDFAGGGGGRPPRPPRR